MLRLALLTIPTEKRLGALRGIARIEKPIERGWRESLALAARQFARRYLRRRNSGSDAHEQEHANNSAELRFHISAREFRGNPRRASQHDSSSYRSRACRGQGKTAPYFSSVNGR
jgi:hypothetical protein